MHHIRRALHLHLTMSKDTTSERLRTYSWPFSKAPHQKGSTLTFDHARKHHIERALHLNLTMLKSITSEGLSLPNWGFLVTDQVPPFSQRMASTLISDQVGHIPQSHQNGHAHIWSCKTTSYNHFRMALNPKLSFPSNWPSASILRMAFSHYIWSCRDQSYNHIRMA